MHANIERLGSECLGANEAIYSVSIRQSVCLVLCLMKEYILVSIILESLSRVEDSIYLNPLSELAKKRQELNDVPVESGVFRIEGPSQFVADPSRCGTLLILLYFTHFTHIILLTCTLPIYNTIIA